MAERIADIVVTKVHPNAVEAAHRGLLDRLFAQCHERPRDIDQCRQTAMAAILDDDDTPAECVYALPRAGTKIIGPSVRLAEIVANSWGNLFTQAMTVDEGDRFVTAQAWALDCQTGCCNSVTRKRRIMDSKGKRYNDDMIQVTSNAAESVAFRAAVFRTIPKPYWRPLFDRCLTLAGGEGSPEVVERMLRWYAELDVTLPLILAYLGIESEDELSPRHIALLRGMATAYRHDELDIRRVFRPWTAPARELQPMDRDPDEDDSAITIDQIDRVLGNGPPNTAGSGETSED